MLAYTLLLVLASTSAGALAAVTTAYKLITQSHCQPTQSQIQWNIVQGNGGNPPMSDNGLPIITFTFTPTGAAAAAPLSFSNFQPKGSATGNMVTLQTVDDGPKAGFNLIGVGCDANKNTFIGYTMTVSAVVADPVTGAMVPVTVTGDFISSSAAVVATTPVLSTPPTLPALGNGLVASSTASSIGAPTIPTAAVSLINTVAPVVQSVAPSAAAAFLTYTITVAPSVAIVVVTNSAAVAAPAIPTAALNTPVATPVPTAIPAAAPTSNFIAATPTSTAATGAIVIGKFSSGFSAGGGYCNGANYINTMGLTAAVGASGIANSACGSKLHMPMGECGLPTTLVTVTYNGAPVNVISYDGADKGSINGNTFTVTLEDDMPYYGGGLTLDIPCSYTDPNSIPSKTGAGVKFAYAVVNPVVQVQTNDNNMVNAMFVIDPASS
ncbi:hypothetical protein HK101_003855 [Irineochytrium annulatum]|nr:hypothetical protein HK101_003855 [Irineochytrium annulatum]